MSEALQRPTSPPAADPGRDEVDLRIVGMHCAACGSRVEEALGGVPGVADASVNLATERAHVRLVTPVPIETLASAVRQAGYDAREVTAAVPDDEERRERAAALDDLRRRLVVAAMLGLPVLALGNLGMWGPFRRLDPAVSNAIQLFLTTPIQWWCGWPFVKG